MSGVAAGGHRRGGDVEFVFDVLALVCVLTLTGRILWYDCPVLFLSFRVLCS